MSGEPAPDWTRIMLYAIALAGLIMAWQYAKMPEAADLLEWVG